MYEIKVNDAKKLRVGYFPEFSKAVDHQNIFYFSYQIWRPMFQSVDEQ